MKSCFRAMAVVVAALALASCGDPEPDGPFLLDFEDRPDDGFGTGTAPPVTLAPGIVVSDVQPSGTFWDFSTANGWGLGPCDAAARSGTLMIGFFDDGFLSVSGVITFAEPVARVDLYGAEVEGQVITLTAFDAQDNVVDIDARRSQCPVLGANDLLTVTTTSNTITRIEVKGTAPVVDDLAYYRFP
jgi:hypothetical protein